ncbi:M28 family metallopeptidase [Clostridium sp. B9]|uniref:M28 family metallopeptidase n=1 Tax=Clostridium sp. B9 TaxID=3423224 RepID=UPI003D2F45ED
MSTKTNEEYFNNNPYNSEKLGEGRNIVAKQSNFDKNKKTIYLTAHYDSTEDTTGVIDNASGCSAILEVAKVLKDYNNEFNIGIIFFSAEEYCRVGSRNFISKLSNDEKENIIGCINVDMVGEKEAGDLIIQSVNGRHNILSFMMKSILSEETKLVRGGSSDDLSFYMGEIPVITITDENSNPDLALKENQFEYIDLNIIKKTSDIIIDFLINFELMNYENVLKKSIEIENTDSEIRPIDGFELVDKKDTFIGNGYSVQREYFYQNENYNYSIIEKDRKFIDDRNLGDLNILSKENGWWYKVIEDSDNSFIKLIFKIDGYYGEIKGNIELEQGIKILENYYENVVGESISIE